MRSLIARYGWKTVAGTLILAIGQIMQSIPAVESYAPVANALGIALGGVGIRCALAKIGESKNA